MTMDQESRAAQSWQMRGYSELNGLGDIRYLARGKGNQSEGERRGLFC